ncbi:MAG: hypothetical protein HY558_02170 [Euryarchaeota archaeon]|nr:hypothetical protein [Euryarchaeota archaeon]
MYARALQRLGETPPTPGNGHGRPRERLPRESTLEEEEGDGDGSAEGPAGGLHYLEKVKGVQGLISRERVPEPLEKGILRARHDVSIFKDGTIRFDMTNLPLTHFRPREAGVPPETLRGLGYTHDTEGRPLEEPDQLLELRPQDILLSASAGDYLVRVAGFIDDLLERHYGLPPFYRVRERGDLVGHLAIGLAPHTSAGVLVRIVGYTPLAASLAHPFFHSAKRRNADGDEDSVILLLDGLLNFSRSYLPASRGGSMDAPLVLTLHIDPEEIDDEAHNLDVGPRYPLEFYEAAERMAAPQEVALRMDLVKHRLGTPGQYLGFHTTHPIARLDQGPHHSAYTQLASMDDKLTAELALARRLRAVDPRDVAERVLNNHLLRDLMGNLRQFSQQSFRCSLCNAKYRRPPLRGLCHRCGVPVHLTVHAASVRKYLQMSQRIAREYQVSDYIGQRLHLIEREIDSLFTPAASRREAAGSTEGDPAAAGIENGKRNGGNGTSTGSGGQMGLGDFL